MYYLIFLLFFIIAFLLFFILKQNKKYNADIASKNKEISLAIEQCNYYKDECNHLRDVIEINKSIIEKDMPKNNLGFEPIYKGKKALVGDYFAFSYENTKRVLESLGFDVTIALSGKEVVKRIKNGEKYDIIFSNNIYRNGTGKECLSELKQIEGFNIPVVIHTITPNKRDYFVKAIGFDDYIVKPVTKEKVKPILKRLLE